MARQNQLGTSYLGLGLEKDEEKKIKKYLKDNDNSAKRLIRRLIREFLKTL